MDSYDVIANQPVVIDNVSNYLRLVVGLFSSSTRYLQCPSISNVPKNHGRSHIELNQWLTAVIREIMLAV